MANNTTAAVGTRSNMQCLLLMIAHSEQNESARILVAKWLEYEHFQGRTVDVENGRYRTFFWSYNLILSCVAPIVLWSVSFLGALISFMTFFKRRDESLSARLLVTDFLNDVLAAFFFLRLSVMDQMYDQSLFEHSHLLVSSFMYTGLISVNVFIECSTYLQFINVVFDMMLLFKPRQGVRWNKTWVLWPMLVVVYSCSGAQRIICDVGPYSVKDTSQLHDGSVWHIGTSPFAKTEFFNWFIHFNVNFDFGVKVLTYMLNFVLAMLLTLNWLRNKQDRHFAKNFQVSKIICVQCCICMVVEIAGYILGRLFNGINDNFTPCHPYQKQLEAFTTLWEIKYTTYAKNFLEAIQIGYYVFPVLLFDKDDFKTAVSEIFRKMSTVTTFSSPNGGSIHRPQHHSPRPNPSADGYTAAYTFTTEATAL